MPIIIAFDNIKSRKDFVKRVFDPSSTLKLSDGARFQLDFFEMSHYRNRESSHARALRHVSSFLHQKIEFGKMVLAQIITTQGMLLGQDETTRQIISEWRADFFIGMLKIFYADLYPQDAKHSSIDEYWKTLKQVLVDSSNWQYNPEHIKRYFIKHALLSDHAGFMFYKTALANIKRDNVEFIQWIYGVDHKKAIDNFAREWKNVTADAITLQQKNRITFYRNNHLLILAAIVVLAFSLTSLWVGQLISLLGIAYGLLTRQYKLSLALREKYAGIFDDNQLNQLNQFYHYNLSEVPFGRIVQAAAKFELFRLYERYRLQKIKVVDKPGEVKIVYSHVPSFLQSSSQSVSIRKKKSKPSNTTEFAVPAAASSAVSLGSSVIYVTKPEDGILVEGTGTHAAGKIIVCLDNDRARTSEEAAVLDKIRARLFNIVQVKGKPGFKAAVTFQTI